MRVLFAEDEDSTRKWFGRGAERRFGATVFLAASADVAIEIFEREPLDILVLDARLHANDVNDTSGLDVLRHARSRGYAGTALVVSGLDAGSWRAAAMAAGATACIHKDDYSASLLEPYVRAHRDEPTRECDLVGRSRAMVNLRKDISDVAAGHALPVLIVGPTGSGKELIAKTLHAWSDRKSETFFAINSSAMAANLVESELFGHERGAFTNAVERRVGAFEAATNGVIFFDEIGDLPCDQQAKLLRVLETKRYRRIGSNDERPTNAWILAATHVDLEERVADGRFRKDLLFRLNVVTLATPSLAERPEDIREIVATLGARAQHKMFFAVEALEWFEQQAWEGNVRELRSFIDRIGTFVKTRPITVANLEAVAARPGLRKTPVAGTAVDRVAMELLRMGGRLNENIGAVERAALERAVRNHGGNESAAAKALGMDRMALVRRMRRL